MSIISTRRLLLLLLLSGLLATGCNPFHRKQALNIPDSVTVTPSDRHIQIAGTQVFFVPPRNLRPDSSGVKFLISPKSNITFIINSNVGFATLRETQIDPLVQQQKQKPFVELISSHNRFLMGKDSAVIVYVRDFKLGTGKIYFAAGSNTRGVMAICTFPNGQSAMRDEILASLLTVYIDSTVTIDYEAICPFTIETEGTPFQFFSRDNERTYYTHETGSETPAYLTAVVPIRVAMLTDKDFEDALVGYYKTIKRETKLEPTSVDTRPLTIDGHKAIESTCRMDLPDGPRLLYAVFVSDGKQTIALAGAVPADDKQLYKALKKLAATIHLK
ncbi:hypothetical protein ACWKWU_02645 [Chitinophaga lutea]